MDAQADVLNALREIDANLSGCDRLGPADLDELRHDLQEAIRAAESAVGASWVQPRA